MVAAVTKFTEEQIKTIRTLYSVVSKKNIAVVFGVSEKIISDIILNKDWR